MRHRSTEQPTGVNPSGLPINLEKLNLEKGARRRRQKTQSEEVSSSTPLENPSERPVFAPPPPTATTPPLTKPSRFSQEAMTAKGITFSEPVAEENIELRKPEPQEWWTARPGAEWRREHVGIIELQANRRFYYVPQHMLESLQEELKYAHLYLCQNRDGDLFVYPMRIATVADKRDSWAEVSKRCVDEALKGERYVRLYTPKNVGDTSRRARGYSWKRGEQVGELKTPWPNNKVMDEILEGVFGTDGVIDNEDHYVVQHLRYGTPLEDLSQRETTEFPEKPQHKTKGNGAGE